MASVSLETKLRWFDRGAAAFEKSFPGVIEKAAPGVGPMYVCPVCDRAFPREAVEARVLTAEHVPPESFGGRARLLTCRRCNNEAGAKLDSHARRKENVLDVMERGVSSARRVKVNYGGIALNAELMSSGPNAPFNLHVVERVNSPAALSAFQSANPFGTGGSINVEFVGDRFADLSAKISWLRSAFLAYFSLAGYHFAWDPSVAIVKRQLRAPEVSLIHCFTVNLTKTFEWHQWKILKVPDPACVGVLFGSYLILLPRRGDVRFYERLEKHVRSLQGKPLAKATADSYEPSGTEPTFGYEIEPGT